MVKNDLSLYFYIRNLWKHISDRRKSQFFMLSILTVLTSFAEAVSLASVVPFIGSLVNSSNEFNVLIYNKIYDHINIANDVNIITILSCGFAIAAIISAILRLLLLWLSIRVSNMTGADISLKIFNKTLYQDYSVHVSRSSSEVISAITQKAGAASSLFVAIVMLFSSTIIFIVIIYTLLVIDTKSAVISIVIFSLAYGFIAIISRKQLIKNSFIISYEQTRIQKILQEGFGSIRDILLDGSQKFYYSLYRDSNFKLLKSISENNFMNQSPRFAIEALALIILAVLVLSLNENTNNLTLAFPTLSLLALGAQKLLPLMQQIYGNWTVLSGNKGALDDILNLLNQKEPDQINLKIVDPIKFKNSIEFKNIFFKYNQDLPWSLSDINLKINKGERIGIIGSSGSGKSTLIDILLCLVEPNSGKILIDNIPMSNSLIRSWQLCIAHVPQHIYLIDSTFAENIAFGIPYHEIDFFKLEKVALQAQIHEFIIKNPNGYKEIVGERGVRISGGQRQRIGIARALYKNASVLIFDEATSALDSKTESDLLDSIASLSNELTIIMVAHRLSTLKICNSIYKVDDQKLIQLNKSI